MEMARGGPQRDNAIIRALEEELRRRDRQIENQRWELLSLHRVREENEELRAQVKEMQSAHRNALYLEKVKLNKVISKQKDRCSELERRLRMQNLRVQHLTGNLKFRDERLQSYQKQMQEQREIIARKEQEIGELRDGLQQREQRCRDIGRALWRKEEELRRYGGSLLALRGTIGAMKVHTKSLRGDLRLTRSQIEKLPRVLMAQMREMVQRFVSHVRRVLRSQEERLSRKKIELRQCKEELARVMEEQKQSSQSDLVPFGSAE